MLDAGSRRRARRETGSCSLGDAVHVSNQLAGARTGVCAERDEAGAGNLRALFLAQPPSSRDRVDSILPARNLVFLGSGFMGFMVRQL